MKNRYYVIKVGGDVEPSLHGPYSSKEKRDQNAIKLKLKDSKIWDKNFSGIYSLDSIDEVEKIGSFSDIFFNPTLEPINIKDLEDGVAFAYSNKEYQDEMGKNDYHSAKVYCEYMCYVISFNGAIISATKSFKSFSYLKKRLNRLIEKWHLIQVPA